MKKFFLFAAAVVAALTVNAKVYDFATITKADIQTTAGVTEDEATGKITIAIPGDQSVVEIRLFEDIVLHYNSKEAKNITVDTKNGYFEFPGNGATAEGKALVTVENLTIGDKVVFEAANKGTGDVALSARDGAEGADVALPKKAKGAEGADENGYIWVIGEYTATAADLTISAPGARVRKITTPGEDKQAIDNIEAGEKAVKFFENGQLIILKNGVRYNALGAKL